MSAFELPTIVSTDLGVSTDSVVSKKIYPTSSISYKQLDRKQDHIFMSRNNIDPVLHTYFTMIEVYDGHGTNDCIECIKNTNTVDIIVGAPFAPELALEMMLKQKQPFMPYDSGATFSCVKMFENYVDCRSTGDSEIRVFINRQCVYKSPNHNWANLDEQDRIRHITNITPTQKPQLLSATSITMVDSVYVNWKLSPCQLRLEPTQSLGHRGLTGLQPAVKRIDFSKDDDVIIIIGTDGLWDMINGDEDNEFLCSCTTADEICKLAEDRWKQEWDFIEDLAHPENVEKTSFDVFDDIAVGIYMRGTKVPLK